MVNNDIHIRDWMSKCPYVSTNTVQRNGQLEYGIYPSSTTIRYHENVLGENVPNEIQELDFIFSAKRRYKSNNASMYGFYHDIIKWIDVQNASMNFPTVNEGRVTSVIPTLTQYVSEPNMGEERCQIQIHVTYKKH